MKPLGLTENGLRQCLRIAFGASIGFLVTTLFDLSYGVFFTVLPMLLLGLVPVINGHVARQLIGASVMCGIEVGLVAQLLGGHPILMTMVAFLLFLYRFAFMARGTAFLFGANGVLMLSIMLHYASYPTTDVNNLIASNFFASLLAIAIAFMMHT
ncbi:MAG TPA: 1,4-alpha-glucan branching protein, partial [Idiomarina sp.]|nr:1,4-alpha-glucan branching protein [Idiomarina sp.]